MDRVSTAPVLCYVAPAKNLTARDIKDQVDGVATQLTVYSVRSAVPRTEGRLLIAIDADGIDGRTPPPLLNAHSLLDCLAIIPATQAIPATWLGLLRSPEIGVVVVPGHHPGLHPFAAAALRLRIQGLRSNMVAAVNSRCDNLFAGLDDLVQAVLNNPFGIRTARQLAEALRTTVAALEARCAPLHLTCLEHLITLVRWLSVEYLVNECHLTVCEAMYVLGIRDRSNFRRQWRRASYLVRTTEGREVPRTEQVSV